MKNRNLLLIVSLLVCLLIFNLSITYAQQTEKIEIPNGKSKLIKIDNLGRAAVGNPEVADVIAVSDQELLINGRSPGETTVHIWDQKGLKLYKVRITKEDSNTLDRIRQLINNKRVEVAKVDETILLSGRVDNPHQS